MQAGGHQDFFDRYTEQAITRIKEAESTLQSGVMSRRYGASSFIWVSPFGDDKLEIAQHVAELGFDVAGDLHRGPVARHGRRRREAAAGGRRRAFRVRRVRPRS